MGRGENLLILTEFKTKFFITQNKEKKLHKKKKEQLNIISSVIQQFLPTKYPVFNELSLTNIFFVRNGHQK